MTLVKPLRPRWQPDAGSSKKVTWMELFFDLIFVAAVAQVASPLHHHYTFDGALRFVVLFVLIWWAWTGHAVFATRFTSDDGVQRLLTVLQMFVVAAMAANATEGLDTRSSAGFAAAYAVLRLTLVLQYFRARKVPGAGGLSTRYLLGHGGAALVWLASAFTPAPLRFALWAAALAADLATPWFAVEHAVQAPPDAEHLPERFGLFTIILLGESVVAVMHGMQSQEYWSLIAASAAFGGMTLTFVVWWIYFEGVNAVRERHVRSRRDSMRLHAWMFAHLPLYVGLVLTGVGVQRAIELEHGSLPAIDVGMLAAGLCLVLSGLLALRASTEHTARDRQRSSGMVMGLEQAES